MRWVLPGGAELGERNCGSEERTVACRPQAAVLESMSRPRRKNLVERLVSAVKLLLGGFTTFWQRFFSVERLPTVKLWLEVLAVLVGLIGAILALFGWSRR